MLISPTNHLLVEVLLVTRGIISAMKLSFLIPTEKSRNFIIDQPEVLLIAVVVVATKLCFPLHGGSSPCLSIDRERDLRLDWKEWAGNMDELTNTPNEFMNKPTFDDITADRVTSMSLKELDTYFAHLASSIDKRSRLPPKAIQPRTGLTFLQMTIR